MRRAEFECNDFELIKSHLDEIAFSTISIPDTPLPYAIPLSFCFLPNFAPNGAIGIHGAKAGRKFALLSQNPQVSFSAVKPYAYIGSEFLGGAMIPTQFFFSAMIVGQFRVVEDSASKRAILSALTRKYEPQSENFSFDKKAFAGREKVVFVGIIEIKSLSVKAKFGQNLKQSEFESILSDLQSKCENPHKNLSTNNDKQTLKQTIKMMKCFATKSK